MQFAQFVGILVVGAVLGGALGYFGKCASGTCPLTATPWRGAVVGAVIAALFGSSLLLGPDRERAERKAPAEAPADSILHIGSPEEFGAKVRQAEGVVIADFYADWCGPCRKLAPELARLASDTDGAVTIAKVNVDEQQDLAREYSVSSIPHLVLFVDGSPVETKVGFRSASALGEWVTPHLSAAAPGSDTPPPDPKS